MKKSPRKGTRKFLVSGPVPGFPNGTHEWTSAMNEEQAMKQVALLLQKKYPRIKIYLGNCTVRKAYENAMARVDELKENAYSLNTRGY